MAKFCIFPWIGYRNLHGYYSPCPCMWRKDFTFSEKNSLKDKTYRDIDENTFFSRLRNLMSSKKRKKNLLECCKMCTFYEDIGYKSPRNWGNFYFKEYIKDYVVGKLYNKLPKKYIHLSFTNVCNFKCRMCEPERSTGWIKEAEEIFNKKIDIDFYNMSNENKQKYLNEIKPDLITAKLIHMSSAGEPFITNENIDVLDFLISNNIKDVHLLYNSNMSTRFYRGVDLYKKLSFFNKVIILMSIDGLGECNRYIRGYDTNLKWEQIEQNIKDIISIIPNVELHLYTAVSALNALHVPDLHKYFYNKGYIKANRFRLNPVFKDDHTVQLLPMFFKIKIKEKYRAHILWLKSLNEPGICNFYNDKSEKEYEQFIKYMLKYDKSHQMDEFFSFNKKLDESRNINLLDVFPEFKLLK